MSTGTPVQRGRDGGWAKARRVALLAYPPVVLGTAFVVLAGWSWRKWCDIIVDFGNELYVPWRLAAGDVLYRDLAFHAGPLSQYFNAMLFRLFGVSLTTLIFANLAILAGITLLNYRIFRRVASRLETTLIGLFFLGLFGFSQYTGVANYNYICPYRHEMTHGIAICLLQIFCSLRFVESGRLSWIFAAGLCCGGTALTKAEFFFVSGGLASACAVLLAIQGGRKRRFLTLGTAAFAGGTLLPILAAVALLSTRMTVQEAWQGMFGSWALASNPELTTEYPFYRQLMGINTPWLNLTSILLMCLVGGVFAFLLYFADSFTGRWVHSARIRLWVATVFGGIGIAVLRLTNPSRPWFLFAGSLPVVAVVACLLFLGRAVFRRCNPAEFQQNVVLALWSILSMLLLPKMLLNAQLSHYGFVLAMPSSLLVVYLGISGVPRILRKRFGSGELFRAGALAVIACWGAAHLERANRIYQGKTLTVGNGGDVTYHDPRSSPRNAVIPDVIKKLREVLPVDSNLFVLPNGMHINYLLRKKNPTPHLLLTPWDVLAYGGEEQVLASIREDPPDFILVIINEMLGHTHRYLGEPGYGDRLMEWVARDYEQIRQFGGVDPSGRARILVYLFERRSGS